MRWRPYNKSLGRFSLDGIAPAWRVPQIEVTFDIDANGIVNVSAKDLGTGKAAHHHHRLDEPLQGGHRQGRPRGREYAAEDARRKEEVDTRNAGDQMVYQTEKTLQEMGDRLDAADKAEVEASSRASRRPSRAATLRPSSPPPMNLPRPSTR